MRTNFRHFEHPLILLSGFSGFSFSVFISFFSATKPLFWVFIAMPMKKSGEPSYFKGSVMVRLTWYPVMEDQPIHFREVDDFLLKKPEIPEMKTLEIRRK